MVSMKVQAYWSMCLFMTTGESASSCGYWPIVFNSSLVFCSRFNRRENYAGWKLKIKWCRGEVLLFVLLVVNFLVFYCLTLVLREQLLLNILAAILTEAAECSILQTIVVDGWGCHCCDWCIGYLFAVGFYVVVVGQFSKVRQLLSARYQDGRVSCRVAHD